MLLQNVTVDRCSLHCTVQQSSTELDTLFDHLAADPSALVTWIGAKIKQLQRPICIVPLKNIYAALSLFLDQEAAQLILVGLFMKI